MRFFAMPQCNAMLHIIMPSQLCYAVMLWKESGSQAYKTPQKKDAWRVFGLSFKQRFLRTPIIDRGLSEAPPTPFDCAPPEFDNRCMLFLLPLYPSLLTTKISHSIVVKKGNIHVPQLY